MKLIDAIKLKGNPFWIPDCSRDDLPTFFKEIGFKTGVEIGVYTGENLAKYCQAGLTMYGVDPWAKDRDFYYPGQLYEKYYQEALRNLAPYPNCTLIRKKSLEAVNDFDKRSLDFVYIDGNHLFGHVAMDLMRWSEKVKRGGIIAGHDYICYQGDRKNRFVKDIVDAFAKSYDFTNWYILGSKEPKDGEKADVSLSFMFIKHW